MNIILSSTITQTAKARITSDNSNQVSLVRRTGLFLVLLICSMLVFLLGPNQYNLFPTNGNVTYITILAIAFLASAIGLKYSRRYNQYWQVAYAFFVASAAILSSDLFISYDRKFVALFGAYDENKFMALQKLYDTLLVVVPILILTILSSAKLSSLYLKVGNQHYKWGFGIGTLVLANYFTAALLFFGPGYSLPRLGSVIVWGIIFSFSNSMLEELWIRGLIIKKMIPLVGVAGTVLLTSITFAAMHFLGVAYLPAAVVPIYVINTLTLGVACSVLIIKTDSIWGAYLIHAAADLFLFIATLAVR
jgi:membrane protease YdiL (CAAX protease family)